jgi:hypothetical protein
MGQLFLANRFPDSLDATEHQQFINPLHGAVDGDALFPIHGCEPLVMLQ